MLLVQLAVLTVRGLLRGTIAQVFAFLGLCAGAWVMVAAGGWIGQHWQGARPVAVFFTLRWLVAVLAGLAVAAVFQWWGELAAKAAHDGPFGWVDRVVGGAIGAATGLVLAALVTLALLQGPSFAPTGGIASRSVSSRPLVAGGITVTKLIRGRVPSGTWLHKQFMGASRVLNGAPIRVSAGRH